MDKQKLKTFAIESRRKLIEDVSYQANLLGVSADGINEPFETAEGMQAFDIGAGKPYKIYDDDIKRRESLINEVNDKGFDNVMEEVAYTWFNRIISIRYMELHNYLPSHVRVLSSEVEGKNEPDIITESPNIDLNFNQEDKELIYKLKDENRLDELFQFLFIKQCNKLNELLPGLFEKTEDYMELLLSLSYTSDEGIIKHLIDDISVEDFEQEEIIGWLYQYYNAELKDITFQNLKKNKKILKENIPAATQLFTPDWIVKYMVENSLGRLWLDGHPNQDLENEWKYYLKEAEQEPQVKNQLKNINNEYKNLNPEDIKLLDPCMGSGHILIYAFDVLMQIYLSFGYSKQDASISILENNLYGLDIDDRAYQLAYFSLMMKARSYNRKILNLNINPLISSIQETNNISLELIDFIMSQNPEIKEDLNYLINVFRDAKELGSIINLNQININKITLILNNIRKQDYNKLNNLNLQNQIKVFCPVLKQYNILNNQYDVVVTNPPYMGNRGMNPIVKNYLKDNYSDSKLDLYSVFIEKCNSLTKGNGFTAMITQQSFMFLSTFENLRKKFLNFNLINMVHLGAHAFEEIGGEVVQTTSFVQRKFDLKEYDTTFLKLIKYNSEKLKEQQFFVRKNYYITSLKSMNEIPGSPIAYWASENAINSFNIANNLDEFGDLTGSQNITANNNKYLRFFWEINKETLGIGKKWVFYAKGGNFRKYYGNLDYVVDWSGDARNFYKNNKTSTLLNENYWFKEGITFTALSSKDPSFRYLPPFCVFDKKGPSICFIEKNNLYYLLGLFNSKVIKYYLDIFNPTIMVQNKDIKNLPIFISSKYLLKVDKIVKDNVRMAKEEWDSFETSFDFKYNPLIKLNFNSLSECFEVYKNYIEDNFNKMLFNEEELNKIFIEIYNLTEDIDFTVDNQNIKIKKPIKMDCVKELISYGVGCMFGRYSLDDDGLICAGNNFNIEDYSSFIPDVDNVIPVLDRDYFDDDIVGRFVKFIKITFGTEHLEENLDFIAGALKHTGGSSREVIRNYFLKDFFDDHKKMYKKCPIYWLFDSGKENGFKCLVYMHRYSPNLVARVRTDYLLKTQKAIESQIDYQESVKEHSSNSKDKSRADKQVKLLTKQLNETKVYDEALAHVASQNIELDLDDGVKVNYAKFQGVEVSHEGQKTRKINLLKKL